MRKRPAVLASGAIGALLVCSTVAESHQLDEYLQATRIALAHNRIVLEIDLTPGMAVASQVFASIDRDGDARVSVSEVESYGRNVLQDLHLNVDGRPYQLTLTRADCPSWAEMRDGIGTIRLEAFADAALARSGRHQVTLENAHQRAIGVYLVNALVPSSRNIRIAGQHRDVLQRTIALDVDVTTPYAPALWILVLPATLFVLSVFRRNGIAYRILLIVERNARRPAWGS